MRYLLGIDAGTTSFKAAIFTDEGELVYVRAKDYTLYSPASDIVEFLPQAYWNVLCELLRELLPASGIDPAGIAALSVSSQGETLICLDRGGQTIGNAIVWLDSRAEAEAKELGARFSRREIFERTGQYDASATWTACKILWIKRHEPERFNKTYKFMLLEDYLIYRLTGKIVCEASLLPSTMMYDIQNAVWWTDLINYIGISEDRLPEIRRCGSAVGVVTEQASKETLLKQSTIVSMGAMDQICGVVGAGVIRPGVIAECTGSALTVTTNLTTYPQWEEKRLITCHNHVVPGRYLIMQWCQTAGMVLKWFVDSFYKAEIASGANAYTLVNEEAELAAPGCRGLIVLPHLLGAHSPEYDLNAKGVFFGVTLAHNRGYIARAIMEAVGFMLRRNLEEIGRIAGSLPNEIYSFGGGARSDLWNSIKADITGLTVRPLDVSETACLGASLLAGVACGIYPDIDSASARHLRSNAVFEPNIDNRSVYDETYTRYIELYEALKPVFHK